MTGRQKWQCPQCMKVYSIPPGKNPDLCPKCLQRDSERAYFSCPKCGKESWVTKDEMQLLSGRESDCPWCGEPISFPSNVAPPRPVKASLDQRTLVRTKTQSRQSDATKLRTPKSSDVIDLAVCAGMLEWRRTKRYQDLAKRIDSLEAEVTNNRRFGQFTLPGIFVCIFVSFFGCCLSVGDAGGSGSDSNVILPLLAFFVPMGVALLFLFLWFFAHFSGCCLI